MEPKDGFAYLEQLKARSPEKKQTFSALMDFMEIKAKERGIPLSGQFELTPLCNFDCKMCYTHLTSAQLAGRKLLTAEQWKGLMRAAWEAGMIEVNLTGGECLAYPGFEEIYLYLRSLGCEITVLTNGALLDQKWVDFFSAHPPKFMQITLYGGDEDTYERVTGQRKFGVVYGNIRRALDAGLRVEVTITPNRYMGEGVFDTVRAAKSLDTYYMINGFLIDPKEETGRSGQEHDLSIEDYVRVYKLRDELEGYEDIEIPPEKLPPLGGPHHTCDVSGLTCKAGLTCFTIEWDGRMYACNSIRDIWASPLEEGFLPAWHSIRERVLKWPRIPECIECPYVTVCTNCAAEKARFAEPGKQPLALCERTRYLVQHGVKCIPACE